LHHVLDAIFYVVRTGCPWRYLPAGLPPWPTLCYLLSLPTVSPPKQLALYSALHRAERVRVGRHPDPSAAVSTAVMDSQSVKTVEESRRGPRL
jgi:putative transposase